MNTPRLDVTRLTDAMLLHEFQFAAAKHKQALADRLRRRNPSDAGIIDLDNEVAKWERVEWECSVEINRRKAAGKWNPVPPQVKRVMAKHENSPKPVTRPARPDPDEAPELPPLIVLENGIPRQWRKGDPIY